MEASTAVAVREETALSEALSIAELTRQVGTIQHAMEAVMKDGDHYGVIPGTAKPTLLKPGAEKLCLLFRLAPRVRTDKTWHPDGHLDVAAYVTLVHVPTGLVWATDVEGFCSTRESRYRYRQGKKECPSCGKPALVRSTKKSAYFCISAEGGCGKRYSFRSAEAKALDALEVGKVENPDPADLYNTVIKMATKRALVAAVLVTTAASDIFTQDVEDFASPDAAPAPAPTEDDSEEKQDEEKSKRRRSRPTAREVAGHEAHSPGADSVGTSETDGGEVDASVEAAEDGERQGSLEDETVDAEPEDDEDDSPKISAADRRRLFAVARGAGLNEAELRATIQEITGQSSTADLTKAQLEQIIDEIEED